DETEIALRAAHWSQLPHRLGRCDNVCIKCQALNWNEERPIASTKNGSHAYSTCCQSGAVKLPVHYNAYAMTPPFIKFLLTSGDPASREFKQNIRRYKNALSFTSLGANVD
ncbi:hypothetical protein DFH28DRAFT_864059, partial [Melampsora americana]